MYRVLYDGLPPIAGWQDFRRLPRLTPERLRATPLAEQLDDPRDTLRTATPLALASVPPSAPVVLDQDDTDNAFYACHDAFRLAGVTESATLLILTPPDQRYLAAEWCDTLGYFGVVAHLLIARDPVETARSVTALAPHTLLMLPGSTGFGQGDSGGGQSSRDRSALARISIRQPATSGADLYVVPEAGIVAVRPAGEAGYRPLRRHVLIEAEQDGRLLLTMNLRYHQPLIRLLLPDRGRIAGGRLWLDEVAP